MGVSQSLSSRKFGGFQTVRDSGKDPAMYDNLPGSRSRQSCRCRSSRKALLELGSMQLRRMSSEPGPEAPKTV